MSSLCGIIGTRGQASVTDTVYFLLIISVLCVFMFAFANQYGTTVAQEITISYYEEYATSALKTILYSSTSRNTGSIYDSGAEIDYLFALLKEDYGDNANFEEGTEKTLARDIRKIMAPVADSFDYLFYIYSPTAAQAEGASQYFFLFFHKSEVPEDGSCSGAECHADYICKEASTSKIKALLGSVGSVYKSSSRIEFLKEADAFGGGTTMRGLGTQVDLVMWVAIPLPESVFKPGSGADGWKCEELQQ